MTALFLIEFTKLILIVGVLMFYVHYGLSRRRMDEVWL